MFNVYVYIIRIEAILQCSAMDTKGHTKLVLLIEKKRKTRFMCQYTNGAHEQIRNI